MSDGKKDILAIKLDPYHMPEMPFEQLVSIQDPKENTDGSYDSG